MVDSTELGRPDALYLDWTFTPAPRVSRRAAPIVAPLVSSLDFLTTCYDPDFPLLHRLCYYWTFSSCVRVFVVTSCPAIHGWIRRRQTVDDCHVSL
jgi:hypothetical protein